MSFMGFGKKKQKGSAGEVEFVGQELHVNPSPEIELVRRKARLGRVNICLENTRGAFGPEKIAYFEKEKRKLEMLIKLQEGDY